MIKVTSKGDFSNITTFLKESTKPVSNSLLKKYGEKGIEMLRQYTPKDTGLTSESWYYQIQHEKGISKLIFLNSNIQPGYYAGEYGVPVAIILQYGHGTKNGHWVEGRDYINPALGPIFDELSEKLWKGVRK